MKYIIFQNQLYVACSSGDIVAIRMVIKEIGGNVCKLSESEVILL